MCTTCVYVCACIYASRVCVDRVSLFSLVIVRLVGFNARSIFGVFSLAVARYIRLGDGAPAAPMILPRVHRQPAVEANVGVASTKLFERKISPSYPFLPRCSSSFSFLDQYVYIRFRVLILPRRETVTLSRTTGDYRKTRAIINTLRYVYGTFTLKLQRAVVTTRRRGLDSLPAMRVNVAGKRERGRIASFDLEQIKSISWRAAFLDESLVARFNLKITGDTIDRMRPGPAMP